MDKNDEKVDNTNVLPPNCGSHVHHPCDSCISDGMEMISDSIKTGLKSIGKSLIECVLILSSEDYANSLIKEREAKKKIKEARKEEEAKREAENLKKRKEESEKITELFKEKLKNQIFSLENISDEKKNELFNLFTSMTPPQGALQSIKDSISNPTKIVKKAFFESIKEIKPNIERMFPGGILHVDGMMLAMIAPGVDLAPISFMCLMSKNDDGPSAAPDPLMMEALRNTDMLPYLLMNHYSGK